MDTVTKKSDFILQPYMKSNDVKAAFQVLNTIIPYLSLWFLAFKASSISLWLLPPIMVLMTLFSGRSFSLMHDCGHYSLFNSKRANQMVGFMFGIMNAIPHYPWSRGHAYHHKTNGDWERYKGPSALLSTDDFAKLSPSAQKRYEWLRHPLMLFPGGFFYLVIKPRLSLILGTIDFVGHVFNSLKSDIQTSPSAMIASHKSRNWYTTAEFWNYLFNNISVISIWITACHFLGAGFFLGIYFTTLTFSAAIIIYIFFTQHNFEGSYAHKTEGWDYLLGAIEGSSYLKLNPVLNWFSADIGYHNIHHLSERIPNYNLKDCYMANIHLLSKIKILHIEDMLGCSKFLLWDYAIGSLITIEAFHKSEQSKSQADRGNGQICS
jgi:acyl-lipid omega-6 desaturase (Delta-12 desaturase)